MSWLKRLKASRKNLLGPDFEKAPWYDLDLSGTKVRFRNPPQMVELSNVQPYSNKWDIYNTKVFKEWLNKKGMTTTIFKNGWYFYGKLFNDGELGILTIQMIIQRKGIQNRAYDSLLNQSDFFRWMLDTAEVGWGALNKNIWNERNEYVNKIDPKKDFWCYPKTTNDILKKNINGNEWYRHNIFIPQKRRQIDYYLPLSDDHVLGVLFCPSAIQCDYFDPSHNLDEAVENTVHTFMSNFHVKLSPDAQRRYDAVKSERKKRLYSK